MAAVIPDRGEPGLRVFLAEVEEINLGWSLVGVWCLAGPGHDLSAPLGLAQRQRAAPMWLVCGRFRLKSA